MTLFNRLALAGAACGLLLGTVSCTDTSVQPQSTITTANVFNNPNSYVQFIAKVYAGLAVSGQQGPAGSPDIGGIDEGFSQYLRLFWESEELPADEAVIAWGDPGLPEMNTQLWGASNPFVVALYYRVFFQVGLANEFLRQTSDSALTARGVTAALKTQIQQYRAEARFLRALSYWHGLDIFGSIPLIKETDAITAANPPAQATRQQLYDFVVAELTAIQGDLPDPSPANYGRATKQANQMLLANVYLNAQVYTGTPKWTEAAAAAQSVITSGFFSLETAPNMSRIFAANNNTSPEIIFPVIQDGTNTKTWGGMTFVIHASCGGNMSPGAYGIDGCWYGLRAKPEAYNRFGPGDTRASYFYTDPSQTLAIASISNFNNGYPYAKFSNKTTSGAVGSNTTHVDTDFPMFRLAEAYLIYAEAVARSAAAGSATTALGYVNALRTRAGVAAITAPQLTPQFVLDERGRELMWEGHRRTDLVRYGLFTGNAYTWSWKGGTQAGTSTDPIRNLYPLPSAELVTNPNLKQNPGY